MFPLRFVFSYQDRCRHIHASEVNAYLLGDSTGSCCRAGITLSHAQSVFLWCHGHKCYTLLSPNAWVSVPANNQQCLNDSIIDTERSHGEITGHSPLGFPHCCLGKARFTLFYQPVRTFRGILLSHVNREQMRCSVLKAGMDGKEEEWRLEKKDSPEERGEAHRHSSRKGRTHINAHVSVEDWPVNVISSRLWAESCCFKMPAVVSQITLESSSAFPPYRAAVKG